LIRENHSHPCRCWHCCHCFSDIAHTHRQLSLGLVSVPLSPRFRGSGASNEAVTRPIMVRSTIGGPNPAGQCIIS
jgi:hypothetical protein